MKQFMKMKFVIHLLAVCQAAVLLGAGEGETVSRADARSRIGEAVADAKVMAEIMKGLSDADQVEFVADVNEAIVKMQASVEVKVAKALDANRAAVKSAKKGNLAKILAEMYAGAMNEALAVICERFADELFNRAADPSKTFTDEEFTAIASQTLEVINERCGELDDSAIRETFAILMFLHASNGTPLDLDKVLVALMPDVDSHTIALTEWIPAAMGVGQEKSYEPLLAAAEASHMPDLPLIMRLSGPQMMEALLADLNWQSRSKDGKRFLTRIVDSTFSVDYYGLPRQTDDSHIDRIPRTLDEMKKWHPDFKRGDPDPTRPRPEPGPYGGQSYES